MTPSENFLWSGAAGKKSFLGNFASAFCSKQLLLAVSRLGSVYTQCPQLTADKGKLSTKVVGG